MKTIRLTGETTCYFLINPLGEMGGGGRFFFRIVEIWYIKLCKKGFCSLTRPLNMFAMVSQQSVLRRALSCCF